MRDFRAQAAARCRQLWHRASQTRHSRNESLPRICVIVLVIMGLLVMVDVIPRMVIIASEARETSYWESWEEAYIDKQSGAFHSRFPQLEMPLAMHDGCAAGKYQQVYVSGTLKD